MMLTYYNVLKFDDYRMSCVSIYNTLYILEYIHQITSMLILNSHIDTTLVVFLCVNNPLLFCKYPLYQFIEFGSSLTLMIQHQKYIVVIQFLIYPIY